MKNPFFMFLMGYLTGPCLALAGSIIFGDTATAYIYISTSAILLIAAITYGGIRKR